MFKFFNSGNGQTGPLGVMTKGAEFFELLKAMAFIDTPKIPKLATGGVVRAGINGRAIVAHDNEAILPLPKFNLDKILTSFASPVMINGIYKQLTSAMRESQAGGFGGKEEITYNVINVENFIGEEEWFNELMKKHHIKVVQPGQINKGIINRRVSSVKDGLVRYS